MFSLFNFSSIFPGRGGQLTPFAPMCGRPCGETRQRWWWCWRWPKTSEPTVMFRGLIVNATKLYAYHPPLIFHRLLNNSWRAEVNAIETPDLGYSYFMPALERVLSTDSPSSETSFMHKSDMPSLPIHVVFSWGSLVMYKNYGGDLLATLRLAFRSNCFNDR